MSSNQSRENSRRRTLLCAALLLTAVALSILHAATPHSGISPECIACRVCDAPAMVRQEESVVRPLAAAAGFVIPATVPRHDVHAPLQTQLRGPPTVTFL